jgi:hypothetical protein
VTVYSGATPRSPRELLDVANMVVDHSGSECWPRKALQINCSKTRPRMRVSTGVGPLGNDAEKEIVTNVFAIAPYPSVITGYPG